jgi:hypothetical protein
MSKYYFAISVGLLLAAVMLCVATELPITKILFIYINGAAFGANLMAGIYCLYRKETNGSSGGKL